MYDNATKGYGYSMRLSDSVYCADADYAAASNDRRPVSGVAVNLGGTVIVCKSSTQKCVTTVNCEAEYVDLCGASQEALMLPYAYYEILSKS